jgi:hypothetical protein
MFADPWREVFVRHLVLVSVARWNEHYWRQWKRKGTTATYKTDAGRFVFRFPRRPKSVARRAGEAARLVLSAGLIRSGSAERNRRLWAAVVWLAGEFLLEPRSLRCEKLTLTKVARHFRLTERQVHYAADKLKNSTA